MKAVFIAEFLCYFYKILYFIIHTHIHNFLNHCTTLSNRHCLPLFTSEETKARTELNS